MKRRWFRTAFALSSLVISVGWIHLGAQAHFASFTGTITSVDGLSVPDVEVVATNEATQVKYTAKSNEQGLYTISALPIGTYVVRAQSQQFRPFQTNAIKLESGQTARLDITLALGATERVDVTAVSPILQTQDAVVGEVISGTTIERMPLNGRNFSQLSLLLPGVITTEPDSFTQPKNFGAGRPFVNGQREQTNNYTLDGVDMNEPIDNLLPYQPSPDALAEVRVETNNYSAEFGNVAGAVIGSTIKSGTNQFQRERLRVLARQQHGRQLVGQQPRRRDEGRVVAAHLRRHDRRANHQEQAVLFRRLPDVQAGSAERTGQDASPLKRGGEATSRVSP